MRRDMWWLRTVRRLGSVLVRGRNRLLCPLDYQRSCRALADIESEAAGAEQLFSVPLQYRGYGEFKSIRAKQSIGEIRELYSLVRALRPKAACEIGTYQGGTFYLWCKASQPDATLLSIDLPGGAYGGGYSDARLGFYRQFGLPSQKLVFVRGDSHVQSTLQVVRSALGDRLLDFLLLDGDHTYGGISRDFELYRPLVRKGGLIAFHDILPRPKYPEIEVHRFWDEVKLSHRHREIVAQDASRIGIGVIWHGRETDPSQ